MLILEKSSLNRRRPKVQQIITCSKQISKKWEIIEDKNFIKEEIKTILAGKGDQLIVDLNFANNG